MPIKIAALLVAVALASVPVEKPVVNLPVSMRQSNWRGSQGEGSCVHATTVSLLRWQGRFKTAEHWKKYGNGESPDGLAEKFDREGIRYAYVTNGDVRFLEWAIRTRRGCGVTTMGGAHFVMLCGLDSKWAVILDNNSTQKYQVVPRESFLAEWKNSFGWAVAVLYDPIPPTPR